MRSLLRGQSISRVFIISLLLVVFVPVSLMGLHLYKATWDQRWRIIQGNHQLLAINLANSLSAYLNAQQSSLALLADQLLVMQKRGATKKRLRQQLDSAVQNLQGFTTLAWVNLDGRIRLQAGHQLPRNTILTRESCFINVIKTAQWQLSGIKTSPFTGKPGVFIGQPLKNAKGSVSGVLLAEFRLQDIASLLKQIQFGESGSAMLVDAKGKIVVHADETRNASSIADWSVFETSSANNRQAVVEYFDPDREADVIAAYVRVPQLDWMAIVSQSGEEVASEVVNLLMPYFIWTCVALLLVGISAWLLSRWVRRPIKALSSASLTLLSQSLQDEFHASVTRGPVETRALAKHIETLIGRLQWSRLELRNTNHHLQDRLQQTLEELHKSNTELSKRARRDALTLLPSRDVFESRLRRHFNRRRGDINSICLMLIDVDHLEQINEQYSREAGDSVLVEVANLLDRMMRPGDVVARYGDDEFIVQMRCEHAVGLRRAQEVRETIEARQLAWAEHTLSITVSVGVYFGSLDNGTELTEMLQLADSAMHEAKRGGCNNLIEIRESSAA